MVRKAYKGIGNEADGDGAAGSGRDPAAFTGERKKSSCSKLREELKFKHAGWLPERSCPLHPAVGISRGAKQHC